MTLLSLSSLGFASLLGSASFLSLGLTACGDGGKQETEFPPGSGALPASGGAAPTSGGADSTGGALSTGGDAASSGGAFGTGGETGSTPIQKSAGCSVVGSMTGERTIDVDGQSGSYIVSIPTGYAADTAYPLGFAFHGYGRTHAECQQGDCAGFQSVMKEEAILVYMKSFSEGWEQEAVRDQNAKFFETLLARVEAEFCVDENRVFVAGTSSGASFSNLLGCRYGDKLQAIAPVAGSLPEAEGCRGQVAFLGIHGIDDPHVTFAAGETARDFFLSQNQCTEATVPDLATVHTEIRASRDSNQTNQKCVDYQGCAADLPVRWCEHSEGGYDDSTHGWPTAGGQLIWDFVSSL